MRPYFAVLIRAKNAPAYLDLAKARQLAFKDLPAYVELRKVRVKRLKRLDWPV